MITIILLDNNHLFVRSNDIKYFYTNNLQAVTWLQVTNNNYRFN